MCFVSSVNCWANLCVSGITIAARGCRATRANWVARRMHGQYGNCRRTKAPLSSTATRDPKCRLRLIRLMEGPAASRSRNVHRQSASRGNTTGLGPPRRFALGPRPKYPQALRGLSSMPQSRSYSPRMHAPWTSPAAHRYSPPPFALQHQYHAATSFHSQPHSHTAQATAPECCNK